MKRVVYLFCIFACLFASCKREEPTFSIPEPIVIDGHEVVDLGLPSGIYWATCNIGAASPELQGGYFSWGETQEKDAYTDTNYKFYDWNARFLLTKYSTDSINRWDGMIDNLVILEPEDDAATVNWGDKYRMPTREEFQELIDCCTWEWDTINFRPGYRITGKKGANIFLPAAGERNDSRYDEVGLSGVYWSASLCTYHNIDAFTLEFNKIECQVVSVGRNRHAGQSIRPVYSPIKK